jgi:hypothetical protein
MRDTSDAHGCYIICTMVSDECTHSVHQYSTVLYTMYPWDIRSRQREILYRLKRSLRLSNTVDAYNNYINRKRKMQDTTPHHTTSQAPFESRLPSSSSHLASPALTPPQSSLTDRIHSARLYYPNLAKAPVTTSLFAFLSFSTSAFF